MKNNQNSAFTLIELLVVISIIGILAALALVSFTGAQKQSRDTQRKNDLAQYQAALEAYSAKNDSLYPVYAAGVNITDTFCDEIGAGSCPSDPDPDKSYFYVSDGLTYNLTAELESKEANWVVDSSGGAGEISTASPLPGGTPTPVSTQAPTATPTSLPGTTSTATPTTTPTVTPTPTPTTPTVTSTPTSTTCPGCYQGTVCLPGTLPNACGKDGQQCTNCSIFGSGYVCDHNVCTKKGSLLE